VEKTLNPWILVALMVGLLLVIALVPQSFWVALSMAL